MPTVLEDFQTHGVRGIHRFNGRCILADDMGLGKTVQSSAWVKANPHVRPILVICPAFIKDHWESEIMTHVGVRPQVLEGESAMRRLPIIPPKAIIVNYDILQYWVKYIRRFRPKVALIDEIQKIKNNDAICTQAVRYVCEKIPHIIMMGGTGGIENRPIDIWPAVSILRPDKFPDFSRFVRRYCAPKREFWGWNYNGASNLEELHKKLVKYCLVRRRQPDVMPELAPIKRKVITVEPADMTEYQKMEADFKRWLATHYFNQSKRKGRRRREMKAKALARSNGLKMKAAELKMKAVMLLTTVMMGRSGLPFGSYSNKA